jgi:hypothetical protein
MQLFEIKPKRTGEGVELTGPVGSNGILLFKCVRDAASHARWQASQMGGGILKAYDAQGRETAHRDMTGSETPDLIS